MFGCFDIASSNKVHTITNVAMLRMKQLYHIDIVKQAKVLAKEKIKDIMVHVDLKSVTFQNS